MIRGGPLDVRELLDSRLLEPRKVLERYEQFFVSQKQPETMFGNVGDFNFRSDDSRHL